MNQPFNDEKEIDFLKQKLIKSQLFSGGWAWWSDGNINYTITNYVLDVLAMIKDDSLANYTARNGLLFLQNNLSKLSKQDLLNTLQTMSRLGSMIDYSTYLQKINFDSASIHQQWQMIAIYQNLKQPYQSMLQKMLDKSNKNMVYGMYWGDENYNWSNTRNITTNLAF